MSKDIIVAKFGGTSVGTGNAMRQSAGVAIDIGVSVVVVSAVSGATDKLLNLASNAVNQPWSVCEEIIESLKIQHNSIAKNLKAEPSTYEDINALVSELATLARGINLLKDASNKTVDSLVSIGERLSSTLMLVALQGAGVEKTRYFDARKVIKTDDRFKQAKPDLEKISTAAKKYLVKDIKKGVVFITQGFVGLSPDGNTTTLGRGGSDYSAALFAEAIEADKLYIWTDVAGISTTDPRITKNAQKIKDISYHEATEMATGGARVIYPRMLLPAQRKGIPVYVGSTFNPEEPGTWIVEMVKDKPLVRAVTIKRRQSLITLTTPRMSHAYGFLAKIFEIFADHRIDVDQVTTSEVAVAISAGAATFEHKQMFDELKELGEVKIDRNLSVVSLIGNRVNETPGLVQEIFNSLQKGKETLSIRMICQGASQHNIAIVVPDSQGSNAVRRLHEHFIEKGAKT